MLGAYAGLRRSEIAALHASQISDQEILVTGKGGPREACAAAP